MVKSSPIICFTTEIKCVHVLTMEAQSINLIIVASLFLPDNLPKSITVFILAVKICLFNWQKNSSTGANSGVYGGKYIQEHILLLK